jgi:hypothetical protein
LDHELKSKKEKMKATKTKEGMPDQLIIQELNIVSADRSRKDVSDWKQSLLAAESIYYPNRSRLYDLYSDAILDGHLTGVLDKRFESVLNKSIYFTDQSGKRVTEMDRVIESETFRDIVTKILESQAWGLTGLEFIPGSKINFKEIPRKHIKPHKKLIAFDQNGEEGISYDGVSNIWVIGKDNDLGYLLKCAIYVTFKRGGLGDYAQFVEIFGQPIRIIKYDSYDLKTKTELRKVIDEAGSSLALMIPKQSDFEMMDGKQSNADGNLQLKFLNFCNEEISVIVLGNTETTKASSSSGYAQSKEHSKQQIEKTKSDMKFVIGKLNSIEFFNILISYGLPVEGGRFRFDKEVNLEDLKSRVEIDKEVANQGVPIDDEYWYEKYGIAKPQNYSELKKQKHIEKAILFDKSNLSSSSGNFWHTLRTSLADFFDPAR